MESREPEADRRGDELATVSVWFVPLRGGAGPARRLLPLLDRGESARAARFASPELRQRYVVAHGALRLILSTFIRRDPRTFRFGAGPRGKPHLAGGPHFSLSHTDDLAVVAVTSGGPIGVDVERMRTDLGIAAVARPLIPSAECARIDALPPAQQDRAWFQAWTRCEALAKASGRELGYQPSSFRTWDLELDGAHVGALAAGPWATRVAYESLLLSA